MFKTLFERTRNIALYGHYIPVDYFVFDDRRLVYVSIPKVACTSIKIALMGDAAHTGNEYLKYMNIHHDVNHRQERRLPKRAKDYFKFAFVRNPFDRLVSFYEDKVRRPRQHNGQYYFDSDYNRTLIKMIFGTCFSPEMKFADFAQLIARVPDWLADAHFKSQYAMLFRHGRQIPDFIGHFETIEEDWKLFNQNYGLRPLATKNANAPRDWKTYYSDEAVVELVARRYHRDLVHFGYEQQYAELCDKVLKNS
jgi:hypothetical protein